MIREARRAEFWNPIANDPAVRPQLGGEGDLDLTNALALPSNIPLATDHGGFIFVGCGAGRYELHTMFLPQGRGAAVLPAFALAAEWMFVKTDALEIVTKTAASNRAAAIMARRAGFRAVFTRGGDDPFTYYALTLDEWTQRAPATRAAGKRFHAMLEAHKHATGSTLPIHPDDAAHDSAAGAAVLMAEAGQPEKAVWTYNRWAVWTGYQIIGLTAPGSKEIDVRDAIVTVRDGRVEVV